MLPSTVRCLIYFAPGMDEEEAGCGDGRGFGAPGLLRSFLAHHWGIVISYVDGVFSEGTNSNAFACSLRQDFKRR
ncbi:hypothetical protein CI1B_84420 [Bradyrhizobium ivorense]|uniref:Uncharacterized protein n=1 Tax=Bradyrhizobium ivorense TaxID=2511166 RepID=A0A508U2H4_9BRAD|nr:hypothetical protein CI1B_84420 [Bradyrhizobium ivorense]